MSKLRKLTRDDFEETMNRLYVYGGPLSEYDFSNHDFRELNIGCYTEKYINCNFSNSDMADMDMRDISFVGCNFTNAKLDNANFTNTRLESCTFENASMVGADFTGAKIYCTDFNSANLSSVNFTQADLRVSGFFYANLTNAVFDDTLVRSTVFRNSDVSGVNFKLTMLNGYSLNALTEAKNLDLTSRFDVTSTSGGCEKIISPKD